MAYPPLVLRSHIKPTARQACLGTTAGLLVRSPRDRSDDAPLQSYMPGHKSVLSQRIDYLALAATCCPRCLFLVSIFTLPTMRKIALLTCDYPCQNGIRQRARSLKLQAGRYTAMSVTHKECTSISF
eukprot:4402785-Pleurochrysis_carterae.AAC.3